MDNRETLGAGLGTRQGLEQGIMCRVPGMRRQVTGRENKQGNHEVCQPDQRQYAGPTGSAARQASGVL
jgi:hypothetical protein